MLGLLSFGMELSGYELKQWATISFRFFWPEPPMSQIYRELGRLAELGLVEGGDESAGSSRPRTAYSITDSGRAELRRWLAEEPLAQPVIRHPAAFRLFLGHLSDAERLRELIEEHRRNTERLLDDLAAVVADLSTDPDTWKLPLVVADWGRAVFEADLVGADRALAALQPPASQPKTKRGR